MCEASLEAVIEQFEPIQRSVVNWTAGEWQIPLSRRM